MMLLYKSDYTIAYVNFSLYICIASHMTGGRGQRRLGCPFFRVLRRAERSEAAPIGSKVVLPPLFPLPNLRTQRNPRVPQVVARHLGATAAPRPRRRPRHSARASPGSLRSPTSPALLAGVGGAFLPAHPGGLGPAGGRWRGKGRARRGQGKGGAGKGKGRGKSVTRLTFDRYPTFLISLQTPYLSFIN